MRAQAMLAALVVSVAATGAALAQPQHGRSAQGSADIERERQERIEQFRDAGVPNPERIREAARRLFVLPLEQQPEQDLRTVAREANAYANMVGMIERGYDDERRQSLRYEFVLRLLEPVQDRYIALGNEFKDIRNRAYFNLARKAEAAGDRLQALMLFNDAFRLSTFTCPDAAGAECLRLDAEREVQRLLGIRGIQPYTRWR